MDIFNYLMNKKGKNLFYNKKALSYLLGKNVPHYLSGTSIEIDGKNVKIQKLEMTKESTQDGTPTPSSPVEVNTVKGYRNLMSVDFDNSSANNLKVTLENMKANTYTLSFDIENVSGQYQVTAKKKIDETITTISTVYNIPKLTFELDTDATLILEIYKIGILPSLLSNVMLNIGNTSLPYVPYGTNWIYTTISDGTNTKQIPLPLNNNEIAGIGDYKDEYIVDKNGHCWLNKKIGKVVLDGTEDWTTSAPPRFNGIIQNLKVGSSNNPNVLCNNYNANYSLDNYSIFSSSTSNLLSVMDNRFSSYNEFTEWLSTHNTEVYYVLAEENLIDLNYNVDLTLYSGTNTITNSENMDMYLIYHY